MPQSFKKGNVPWNIGVSKKLNNALEEWHKKGGVVWNKGLTGEDNPCFGRKNTPESIEKMSIAAKKRMEGKRIGEVGSNDGLGHLKKRCNCKDCGLEMFRRTDTFKNWSGRCTSCAKIYRRNMSPYRDDKTEVRERYVARRSKEYREWRDDVLNRDNNQCVICGYKSVKSGDIIADHIKPFYLYKDLRYERVNGRSLCLNCNHVYGFNKPRDGAKIVNIDFLIDKKMCWKMVDVV